MNLGAAMLLALHGWLPMIQHEARAARVDPLTVAAIVWHESHGDPNAYFKERGEACSVGLGGVYVPTCDARTVSELHDPVFNVRASARILAANQRWCRKHRKERRCKGGERLFPGQGGAVVLYGGARVAYAGEIRHLRAVLLRELKKKARRVVSGHVGRELGPRRLHGGHPRGAAGRRAGE